MAALVADYGSDSTSDSEDDSGVSDAKINMINEKNKEIPLIPANVILDQAIHGQLSSIFANPFLEAEKCQKNSLEKHVKMTNVTKSELTGKNVCYKFQKGRCPFGNKCKYFHPQTNVATNEPVFVMDNSPSSLANEIKNEHEDDGETNRPKKKRYGLKDTLEPPKGYLKVYNKLQKRS